MSCKNLETIIVDMARGQMLEARVLENANAHLELCKPCAARFADELALSGGLRSMAASATTIAAPARVEAALLSAFRQSAAGNLAPAISPTQHSRKTGRWSWSVAAAAAVLIAVALTALTLLRSGSPALTTVADNAPPETAIPVAPTPFIQDDPDPTISYAGGQQRRPGPRPAFIPVASGSRSGSRSASRNALEPETAALSNSEASATDEISTEFLPLTHGSSLAQMDDGQIVRVELPRSALHSFGLTVNAERAGERVKADVLLGYDGVARAIRFVK